MAERLTEKDKYGNNAIFQKKDKFTIAKDKNNDIRVYGKAIDKLAQLEDIMEKYGIESVEELDKKIDDFTNFMKGNKFETIEDLQNALNGKFIEVFDEKNKIWQDMVKKLTKTEKDRDTWKRACDLYNLRHKGSVLPNVNQLAIQELEKVKELLLIESKNNPIIYDVNDDTVGGALDRDKVNEIIDQQIKLLKGEKDVED